MRTNHHTVVITGATSGIGKAFALEYARKGFDLILTGRRRDELQHVADTLSRHYPIKAGIFAGDLSDPSNRNALSSMIENTGIIDVLINNAGFGIDRPFYGNSLDDIRSMINTHVLATTELTHAVLPGMMRRRKGTIINVSSLVVFTPALTRCLYFSTKSFVHCFTEALSMEMHPYGIKVQSLCPGLTRTDFHRDMKEEEKKKKFKLLDFACPEKVVSHSLKTLESGSVTCIPGLMNKLLYMLARLLPLRFQAIFVNHQ